MEIQPSTNIKILKNVPLDTTYDHTIWFENVNLQYQYFFGKRKYTLNDNTYQRVNKGKMRVGILSDNLYDCNYLMFQNTAFGNKWFYAFIKKVEYVNNITSEIEYELDPLQTWMFDYNLDYCFVEREHSASDELFSNLVDENLDLGDYTTVVITDPTEAHYEMGSQYVGMLTSGSIDSNHELQPSTGSTKCNVYTPLNFVGGVPASDETSLMGLIDAYIRYGYEDAIVCAYQYPATFGVNNVTVLGHHVTMNDNLDGYTPHNNKLFSHPYNMLVVDNNSGQTAEYKWEQWEHGSTRGNFAIAGCAIGNPSALLYPLDYRGQIQDYASGLMYSNFPAIPIVGDAFKAWWAQNKTQQGVGVGTSLAQSAVVIGGAVAGATTPLAGVQSGITGASSVANLMAKKKDLQNTPPQVHGQVNSDYLNAGMGRCRFTFYRTCIRYQFARMIDRYFDRFGYATRLTKIPNTHSRPHWNYVKTIDATITGSIPCDDMKKICDIHNKGITYWKNGSEVGNYGLDNRPT